MGRSSENVIGQRKGKPRAFRDHRGKRATEEASHCHKPSFFANDRALSAPEIKEFLETGLAMIKASPESRQIFMNNLSTEGGLARIRDIVETDFSLSYSILKPMFDPHCILFLRLISHDDIISSLVFEKTIGTIYNVVYGPNGRRGIGFFSRLGNWVNMMCAKNENQPVDKMKIEALSLLSKVLLSTLTMNQEAVLKTEFREIAEILCAFHDKVKPKNSPGAHDFRTAQGNILKIKDMLSMGESIAVSTNTTSTSQPAQKRHNIAEVVDLPGMLSKFGPRHDNDHALISDIRILPTISEILSDERPEFLPTRPNEDEPPQHHQTGLLRLLDSQFRLLREDTSGLIRDSIRLILENWQTFAHNPDWRLKRKILRDESPTPVRMYLNAKIQQLKSNEIKGVELDIEFDQVRRLKDMKPTRRGQWWRESGALREGGPVVALVDGEQPEDPNVIFFLVTRRVTEHFAQNEKGGSSSPNLVPDLISHPNRASVGLRLTNPEYDINVSNLVFLTRERVSSRPLLLVEFPAIKYNSFEGILRCLQSLHHNPTCIPFPKWLASSEEGKILKRTPSRSWAEEEVFVPPPAYLNDGMIVDLSCIPTSNDNLHDIDRSITMSLSQDFAELSTYLSQVTTLDAGQAAAMASALRREVALIQGPPGTGKSYVGIQLARCLVNNRNLLQIGPVLCVCYTNHALDQFLHELLDSGVANVVRIGYTSRSPSLEKISFETLKNGRHTPQINGLGKRLKACRARLTELSMRIEQICSMIKQDDRKAVGRHLKKKFPQNAKNIFSHLPEQEFAKRLEYWLSGDATGNWNSNNANRTIDELLLADAWTLKTAERTRLYRHWRDGAFAGLSQELSGLLQLHGMEKQHYTNLFKESDIQFLNQFHVVGVTTTGLANNSDILRGLSAKVLICEEAGEVLESHILTALLPSIQHLILIGDHLQLRPRISNLRLSMEYDKKGPKYNLDESLFERLASSRFNDMVLNTEDGQMTIGSWFPVTQLNHQRRMHPSISALVRKTLYPGLKDHPSTESYPEIAGMKRRLFWLDHRNMEDATDPNEPMQSKTNTWEAHMVTALARHLLRQGKYKSGEVAVLTPYVGQLKMLKEILEKEMTLIISERDIESLEEVEKMRVNATSPWDSWKISQSTHNVQKGNLLQKLRMATVDNFQGEEATVIIVSLVRSNQRRNCGFLESPNRINVLLSRAKHGMYIIGDAATASTATMWQSVIEIFEKDANIGQRLELQCSRHPKKEIFVSSPDDFSVRAPEGGCAEKCGLRLNCGHSCTVKCHSATQHQAVKCMQSCNRMRDCGHSCRRKCYQPCGECQDLVSNVMLPCGHSVQSMECRQVANLSRAKCQKLVIREIPGCGHKIEVHCHENTNPLKCSHSCDGFLPCGHQCRKPCWECPRNPTKDGGMDHGLCNNSCGRAFKTCSHVCDQPCHPGTACPPCNWPCEVRCKHSKCPKKCREPCPPCAEQCGWSCEHRERCNLPCAVPCDIIPCSLRCTKKLVPCGHQCPGVCGESCPESRFCQMCCASEILRRNVDLIEFKEYREIDLDKDPLVFLFCGHFYTLSSLDGMMEMDKYYTMDPSTGGIILPKITPWVFNAQDSPKGCPECRMPLRDIDRYNRVIKKALLNEGTKRFVSQAHAIRLELFKEVEQFETNMELERVNFVSEWSNAESNARSLIQVENSLEAYRQKGIQLNNRIKGFIKSVKQTEQPFGRVKDLLASAVAKQKDISSSFRLDDSVIQTGFQLYGQSMSLRLSWALLWDLHVISATYSIDSRISHALHQLIATQTKSMLNKCLSLLHASETAKFRVEEIQARIYHVQFSTLSVMHYQGQKSPIDLIDQESARETQRQTLDECEALCFQNPGSLGFLREDIQKARELLNGVALYSFVTTEEKRQVYRAMAEQFSGTGHWYYCENNHPFTIGECGMPMEQARCPQCGAPVGGQEHELVQGVSRAIDMDNEFGGQ